MGQESFVPLLVGGAFPALCHAAANNAVSNKEYCKGKQEESDSIGDLLLKQLY